jgi:Zn-dependent protease
MVNNEKNSKQDNLFEPLPSPSNKKKSFYKKKNFFTAITALVVVLLKFKSILIALKLSKFVSTFISMFFMIWVYSLTFGWKYATGFVMLIAIHESGHITAARILGLNISMPIFIPFVGAFIAMKQQPKTARVEAIVAASGPIIGSIAAFICFAIGFMWQSNLFFALAYTGFLINLFNLIPIHPLDGGRIVSAISPKMWFVGIPIILLIAIKFPNPLLFLLLILGAFQAYKIWKVQNNQYYNVSLEERLIFAILYFGLMILLGSAMAWIHSIHSVKNFEL